MESKTKIYCITITWWYQEEGKYAFTTIYCQDDLLSLVLDKYTNIEVKEIIIEEIDDNQERVC